MDKLIKKDQSINFKNLVENSNTCLSLNCQTKMINILSHNFTEQEQQWYITNLYMYLNYHPTNDFVINLDDIYKMLGFANKGNALKTIKSNFIEKEDYKILLLRTEKQDCIINHGGHNKEDVFLNIDTFKNLCMICKTDKGKEIRKYYLKLENIYNQLIKEELHEKEELLKEKDLLIEEYETKPETTGFIYDNGYIYAIKDNTRKGHIKFGLTIDPESRCRGLNIGSSEKSLEIIAIFYTTDMVFAEKILHLALNPFKIKKRKEWFYFSNDLEVGYALKTMENCVKYVNDYYIKDYYTFKENHKDIKYEDIIEENKNFVEIYTKDKEDSKYTGIYKNKNKYITKYYYNNKSYLCGSFDTELEAILAYNQKAKEIRGSNAVLNLIEEPKEKEDPLQAQKVLKSKNSTNYYGVCRTRSNTFSSIFKHKGINIYIGTYKTEKEAAIAYNKKAIEILGENAKINIFNNLNETNQEIENNIIDSCNSEEIPNNFPIKKKKTSNSTDYYGVCKRNGRYIAVFTYNKKSNWLGTYNTVKEAAIAYNKKAIEICGNKFNRLNNIQL